MCPARRHSLAAIVLAGVVVSQTHLSHAARPVDYHAAMLARVNHERATHDLPPLCLNRKLQAAAKRHSNDMARHDFMDHGGSDRSSMAQRISEAGYEWDAVAENVAAGQEDVEKVMQSWMASEGHRENIMNPTYTMFGTACTYNKNSSMTYYWTQDFGRGDTEACEKDAKKKKKQQQHKKHKKHKKQHKKKRRRSTLATEELNRLKQLLRPRVSDPLNDNVASTVPNGFFTELSDGNEDDQLQTPERSRLAVSAADFATRPRDGLSEKVDESKLQARGARP